MIITPNQQYLISSGNDCAFFLAIITWPVKLWMAITHYTCILPAWKLGHTSSWNCPMPDKDFSWVRSSRKLLLEQVWLIQNLKHRLTVWCIQMRPVWWLWHASELDTDIVSSPSTSTTWKIYLAVAISFLPKWLWSTRALFMTFVLGLDSLRLGNWLFSGIFLFIFMWLSILPDVNTPPNLGCLGGALFVAIFRPKPPRDCFASGSVVASLAVLHQNNRFLRFFSACSSVYSGMSEEMSG